MQGGRGIMVTLVISSWVVITTTGTSVATTSPMGLEEASTVGDSMAAASMVAGSMGVVDAADPCWRTLAGGNHSLR